MILRPAGTHESVAGSRKDVDGDILAPGRLECRFELVDLLGRDAPIDRVERWLKVGAAKRFVGFAVGRTIWEEPLGRYLGGAISSEELVDIVADNYSTLVDAYIGA